MFKEMPQRHEQLRRVSDPTLVERFVNVINDHGSDGFAAMGLRQQVVRQCGRSHFGDVLMLADRSDFSSSRPHRPMQSCSEIMANISVYGDGVSLHPKAQDARAACAAKHTNRLHVLISIKTHLLWVAQRRHR